MTHLSLTVTYGKKREIVSSHVLNLSICLLLSMFVQQGFTVQFLKMY